MPKPTVFISYSREDESWKDKLVKHLKALDQELPLEVWHDRMIGGGANWREEIQSAMNRARIAIVLVSVDFLLSQFIREEEVPRLLDRCERDGMLVFPVIVKACGWRKIRWLSAMNARPLDGKPLEEFPGNKVNRVLAVIASEILDRLEEESQKASAASESFLVTYRRCLSAAYSHWDLAHAGVTQAGGAGAPIEAKLDDMYLPLRLGEGFDLKKTNRGVYISPADLLSRERPLVIRGAAGSGKTTWMRWTFRRLLEMEEAFPLMLVLRDLARRWQDTQCKGAARSLDTFLEEWLAGFLGGGLEAELKKHLAAEEGPRPVLLVDGWDETGPLGKELREKLLVLMKHYPRLQVVVTSRPYGESRPSDGEGFDLLDIQPLSDDEIGELSHRFFTRCYGQDEITASQEVERFQRALTRAPEPHALARTVLLLTMMLLISRSRPLPDKRHLLYEVCIENLLTALPERKAEEGALLQREQWRPDDSEERMRVVAALAFAVQSEGYKDYIRASIVQEWEEMAGLLPAAWSRAQRLGFLGWLAGPGGLLTDRADGTLVFTHLSFQEFLTAWHLNANVEGTQPRIKEFCERLNSIGWWETLRLWAALIERQSRGRLDPVLDALAEQDGGISLVGTMLADGLGAEERVEIWCGVFLAELSVGLPDGFGYCCDSWGGSRQELRKRNLARILADRAPNQNWSGWFRLMAFSDLAGLGQEIPFPASRLSHAIVSQVQGPAKIDALYVAAGRVLCGGPPLWPIEPAELGLLQAWPSRRRVGGIRLQLAASYCLDRAAILELAKDLMVGSLWGDRELEAARGIARVSARYLARDAARASAREFASVIANAIVLEAGKMANYSVPYLRDYLFRFAGYGLDLDFRGSIVSHFSLRGEMSDLARERAASLPLEPTPALLEFITSDLLSMGRVGARAQLAHMRGEYKHLLIEILSKACRLSVKPGRSAKLLEKSLRELTPSLDPLWPALARHLARRSTEEDRALLIDLAQHPEHRDPPLSWGLQYIVRGDVMFEDASVATLDELADEVGLPHLPYLEEMPDELEIDWDKKD